MSDNPGSALLRDYPHRRFNALTGEWIFVSPHRTVRPWLGREEPGPSYKHPPHYDRDCYLCPGNARSGGDARNPEYRGPFVFTNDFPAFLPNVRERDVTRNVFLRAHVHSGTCRVLCYSERHDLSLGQLAPGGIRAVIDTWADQLAELGARWRWVQIFENKGELMGASNPHPHGQIWAGDFLPTEIAKEHAQQQSWLATYQTPLLVDYAALEASQGERVVLDSTHWMVVVPWWAVWPFETLLLPRRHVPRFTDLTRDERDSLAETLRRLLLAYDRLFDTPLPYSFGWHGAPTGADYAGESSAHTDPSAAAWQLHAHFYPPLLRSATVRKFMVGYEMLAEAQRDLTPEQAAERLRGCIG
jgi:UDPglucose--hexose-1-phosphate uridylyltransferase